MEDLSLHVLDIAENSLRAGATLVEISVVEDASRNRLELEIRDNGSGMEEDMAQNAADPFVTSRTERPVGLGLALLEQSTREAGGSLEILSAPGRGTRVRATFQADHIDRKPLGDMAQTLSALMAGYPDRDFVLTLRGPEGEVSVDTRELRAALGEEVSLGDPRLLGPIKALFRQGDPGRSAVKEA